MTDKGDKIAPKPVGIVYTAGPYNGTTWYVIPAKPWKLLPGKRTEPAL